MSETIYALASAPGRAGVAVIRVSGSDAWDSLSKLCPDAKAPQPRMAVTRHVMHPVSRETIDQALVIGFKGPASFTGEDVVEFHLHGGRAVIDHMIDALAGMAGFRLAYPGEFTRRAFENGKLDLTAAEAVADLINAETQAQKEQALAQMGGALSDLYHGWADRLARVLAYLEADLDFPDEDLPDGVVPDVLPKIDALRDEIDNHLSDNRRGERLRDGIHVAVIGAPNAGKSSLINALAQRDVAIVSDVAGTTRDVIEAHLDLGGYPVIVADTAGLRPEQLNDDRGGHDAIESEGIKRAISKANEADITILVFDAGDLPDLHTATMGLIDDRALILINKCDLKNVTVPQEIAGQTAHAVSVHNGDGLAAFLQSLESRIADMLGGRSAPALTRRRHRDALEDAFAALAKAPEADMPELMAEDIRMAVRALGRITGRVDVEDLLDIIFRDFCIGK